MFRIVLFPKLKLKDMRTFFSTLISSTAFLEVFKLLAQKLLPTICSPEPTKRYVSHGSIVSGFLIVFFGFYCFSALSFL